MGSPKIPRWTHPVGPRPLREMKTECFPLLRSVLTPLRAEQLAHSLLLTAQGSPLHKKLSLLQSLLPVRIPLSLPLSCPIKSKLIFGGVAFFSPGDSRAVHTLQLSWSASLITPHSTQGKGSRFHFSGPTQPFQTQGRPPLCQESNEWLPGQAPDHLALSSEYSHKDTYKVTLTTAK